MAFYRCGSSGGTAATLLWTNPSPTTAFSKTTITFNSGTGYISDYTLLEFQFFMSTTKADPNKNGFSRYAVFTDTWTIPSRTTGTGADIFNHYDGSRFYLGGQTNGTSAAAYIRTAYPGDTVVTDASYNLNTNKLTISTAARVAAVETSTSACIPYRIYGWKL